MSEVIVFPDVEALVCDYLRAELTSRPTFDDVTVATKVPTDRDDSSRFVRVIRTGGATPSLVVDEATLTVEAWATREADAVAIAQLCRGLLLNLDVVSGVQFYRVGTFSAPANLPDPTSDQVRYSASYAVRVRGIAA